MRQLVERNHPSHSQSPDAPSAGTSPPQPLLANRIAARRVIPDVARRIGVNEILPRTRESRDGGREFLPIVRAIDIEKRKLKRPRVRRGPAQRVLMVFVAQKNRPVPRDPRRHLNRLRAFHGDRVALQARLLQLASEHVPPVLRIDLFAIQILHIELQIGDAPGNASRCAR